MVRVEVFFAHARANAAADPREVRKYTGVA